MAKIITFGEIMMRLNPPGYQRFLQTSVFEATYAGGEANVAVSLSNFGDDAAFVSKVPDHEIGQNAVNALRRYGVDTSMILRGGPRLGVYYCEKGASQRGSKVLMTGQTPPLQLQSVMSLTGTVYFGMRTGSTLPASHRLSAETCPLPAWMHAKLRRKEALRFPAT